MDGQQGDGIEALEVPAAWLDLGLVTSEQLSRMADELARGDDPNPEHYRWSAFRSYLDDHRPLPPEMAAALYRLGSTDPDSALGQAMMGTIVDLPECPVEVRQWAFDSGEKHLVRRALRRELAERLAGGLTGDLFEDILRSGDAALQRSLLEAVPLTSEQLQRLAGEGASRAVRNIAATMPRKRVASGS